MSEYRMFNSSTYPLGESDVLVRSNKTDKACIMAKEAAQMLLKLNTFASLDEHIEKIMLREKSFGRREGTANWRTSARRLIGQRIRENSVDEEAHLLDFNRNFLAELVNDGHLVSHSELYSTILKQCAKIPFAQDESAAVTSLGIPTRNRTSSLHRSLLSYVDNACRFGRKTQFIIADDSEDIHTLTHNRQALKTVLEEHKVDIFYADRAQRLKFVERLATHASLPTTLLKFALLGHERCPTSYGANRNTLLLDTLGELTIQVDDDTVCHISSIPETWKGLSLTSETHVSELWFFHDNEIISKDATAQYWDFFALHERLLGKKPGCCIFDMEEGTRLHFDKMSPKLINSLSHSTSRVIMSSIGALGDSGMEKTFFLTALKGNSFHRFVEDQEDYQRFLQSRQILRGPTITTLGDRLDMMAMNIGLDNRELLPPFMPVQRSEDSVFNVMLSSCITNPIFGYLPFSLLHDPPVRRSFSEDHLYFRTNDLLKLLILSFEVWPCESQTALKMQAVGDYLKYLTTLRISEFKEYIHQLCYNSVCTLTYTTEQRLEEEEDAPEYWKTDVRAYLDNIHVLLLNNDVFVPHDLLGSVDERWELFLELIGLYGELVIQWPLIVEAVKDLHDKEYRVSQRIE